MLKKLKKICANKKLCEIYHNVDDTSKFMVGYVLACNDNDAVLWLIDRYGHFDGISWILNGEIYRINTNTEYLKACHRLLEYNGLEVMYTFSESSLEDIIRAVVFVSWNYVQVTIPMSADILLRFQKQAFL